MLPARSRQGCRRGELIAPDRSATTQRLTNLFVVLPYLRILLCWLRFCRGSLSFAWPFRRLWSGSVTKSTDFLLLFGSGRRSALAPFLAFLTQLLLSPVGPDFPVHPSAAPPSTRDL